MGISLNHNDSQDEKGSYPELDKTLFELLLSEAVAWLFDQTGTRIDDFATSQRIGSCKFLHV
jgi:hypothetical protein